jgi:prepilin-type processing-associated H-X9-DG protein
MMTDNKNIKLDLIEDAIKDFAEGKMIIVVDDEDRENEGDLKKDPYRGTNNGDIGINGCFHKGYYEYSSNAKYTIRRLEKIVKPSLIFHFGDTYEYNVNYITYLQFRHNLRSTVLFYDGHVELCKPGQLADKNVWASGFGNN